VTNPDEITAQQRGYADIWRPTAGMSDAALAKIIEGDGIDILVDLTMHMARGRPLLMARKPAPVQVSWLAYPGTTGIAAIDYRLTDAYLDPPEEHDNWYTEQSIRLADTFWCYDPYGMEAHTGELPEPGELPMLDNKYVTFGCMNNFCKVNEPTLKLWCEIMRRVAGSRLILWCPAGEARERMLGRFGENGIESNRIEFVGRRPRREFLAEFRRIDISLDTIPYNGHTTSLDSFWMGVPVVSRVGARVVGRAGWSQLSNLQLTELAATTDEQFVRIAVELSDDRRRLEDLRRSLRERMEKSPLMDGPRFARSMEAAYRGMWRSYCEKT
jgi:predicted O-linked N-acetylglucosamine transferase (SPINDLY family)